ncbi:MAG: hypothetical protein LBB63_00765 [Holosporaceae bacterium]|nr:hypothetical protein [Holosporaceae bacterium]
MQFNELRERKQILSEKNAAMEELAEAVRAIPTDDLKSADKIFASDADHKVFLKKTAGRFALNKVFFRINPDGRVEVKFNSFAEGQIFAFIDALWRESGGLVKFESIKMAKAPEGDLAVKLNYLIVSIDKKIDRHRVHLSETKCRRSPESIDLFGVAATKTHNLSCILDNSRAYVNGSWYGVGDKIDGWKILSIRQNFIEIQSENKKLSPRLGASW